MRRRLLHRNARRLASAALAALVALVTGTAAAQAPAASATADAAQQRQRNQAASFVLTRSTTLAIVRAECRTVMQPGPLRVEEIASNWWFRNRDAIDAANGWLQRSLGQLQARDPAAHRQASVEFVATLSQQVLETLRTQFRRQLPDDAACQQALRPYDEQQLDIERMGTLTELARFGDVWDTLKGIRAEPGWQPPPEAQRTYEAQVTPGPLPPLLASLDAAQRARENGDGPAMARAYASMAERGDARAALTLGRLHRAGDLLPQDAGLAYGWFHRAYVGGQGAGLAELADAWRDGLGVTADPRTAWAAYLVAGAITREPAERQRAQDAALALQPRLAEADRAAVACLRVADLEAALAGPLPAGAPRSALPDPQRRIGSLVPALAPLAQRCG